MNLRAEWPDEERIDQIGRNRTEDDLGHYDKVQSASRAEFEDWALSKKWYIVMDKEMYTNPYVQTAWEAWQQARKQRA